MDPQIATVAILEVHPPKQMETKSQQDAWSEMRNAASNSGLLTLPNDWLGVILLRIPMPENWHILVSLSGLASRCDLPYTVDIFGPSLLSYSSENHPEKET